MIKHLLAICTFLLGCNGLFAQGGTTTVNTPVGNDKVESAFPLKSIPNLPGNFYLTELPNGLEVLVMEDHSVPLATIELVVRNGSFVQTPDLEGLAHLYEHMFFKANTAYPSQEEFLARINELGIIFNGTTSEERVNYFVTLGKGKLTEGLEFMNAAARYPKFLKQEMIKEDTVVAGEFQRNESNPTFSLFREMNRRMWGANLSRKNTIGEYKVILNATPEIMTDIKNRYYYPNNSMLVIAGDVSHEDVFKKASVIYGNWARSSFDIFKKYPIPEFDPLKYSTTFVAESENSRVPFVLRTWQGPDTRRDLQNTYAADVFSNILTLQSSKFQKALVESGLAYQVNFSYSTLKYTGPINLIMVPNPAKMQEAMKTVEQQMALWTSDDYFTDEQMATAKKMLSIDDKYSKEQTSQYAHLVTYWWASANLEYYANYINNINKVSRQDIKNYLEKYVLNKPNITGVLVSPKLRSMTKLDDFFMASDSIQNIVLTAGGKDKLTFDDNAKASLKRLAYLVKVNPGRKVQVSLHSEKDKLADKQIAALADLMQEAGIGKDQYSVNKTIKKDKELGPAELKLQNTLHFSFN